MAESLCELRSVTKLFRLPGGGEMRVLDGVSLDVRSEEVLAILGPSGCGKSTVMRLLMGLIRPDGGEVISNGRPLDGLNPSAAMVFQSFALYPWLTVRQNIVEPMIARGLDGKSSDAIAERVIHVVGLGGFEDAYPRELSGGMKQRAGIARALAVEPEILCMDEPFSQVDALTAENLRGEVVRFWSDKSTNPKSIFMVSHDVKEVVFMATRIVVMAARPGRVRTIIENPLPYPRDYRAREFQRLVDKIHAIITEVEMPDEPAAAAIPSAKPLWEPLPDAGASQVIGLLEVIDNQGGRENVFRLVDEIGREFGVVLAVVKAAELLDFVDTPKQEVQLTDLGRRFLDADVPERKQLFRDQVQKLELFASLVAQIQGSDRHELDEDVVKSELALHLPFEDPERLFQTIVNWGRHSDLFDHDPNRGKLFIDLPSEK
jgi:NitT/TauT family transport system ATP-binding protein